MAKPNETVATRLERIRQRSTADPEAEFGMIMSHVDKDLLIDCFRSLKGNKASGVDKQTKQDYEEMLEENIVALISRMKTMSYRPQPVREVFIPKSDGGRRPLGISCIEDKIVQSAFARILEAIYEPVFYDCSYGFRRGRSPHDATRALYQGLWRSRHEYVLDLDIKNYFGSIEQKTLVEFLELKIKDQRFIRYVVRMFKAGIFGAEGFRKSEYGTPQGSILSPILANIYGHYVLDQWFQETALRHVPGSGYYRYCDDCVFHCHNRSDVEKLLRAVGKRLARFGLELHPEKTRIVHIPRRRGRGSFSFLGFTYYIGQSKKGHWIPKVKTEGKRLRSQLRRVAAWCRDNRCRRRMLSLWRQFCRKVQGTVNYYAVSWNLRHVESFVYQCLRILFKWLNRRSQKRSLTWDQFLLFRQRHPGVRVRLLHSLHGRA